MDYHKTCFFCCKHFKYELPISLDFTEVNPACHSIATGDTNCPIKSKASQQAILQLSQYLKVPRNQLAQLQDGHSSNVTICKGCKEISETLSKLCKDLEVTEMKIIHYLNLLTDRIIGINNEDLTEDNKEQAYHPKVPLSDLQKIIHKNCLSKVRQDEDKVIPQVRLTKCNVKSRPPPQLNFDDTEEADNPITVEAGEHQINMDLSADTYPELHSCPFCNYTINCGDKLNDHITNQHSEQFESYTTNLSNSDSLDISTSNQVNLSKTVKKIFKKCEICGLIIEDRNLARHKRLKHQLYSQKFTSFQNRQEAISYELRCDFCPLTFRNEWNKESHTQAAHFQPRSQLVWNKRVKKCEICGAMISNNGMAQHKRTRHKNLSPEKLQIKIRNDFQTKGFRCGVCGNAYAIKRSLWRHYRNSKKCRMERDLRMGKIKTCKETEILTMSESEPKIKNEMAMENFLEQVVDPLQI